MDAFAKKLWEYEFGNHEIAYDFTKHEIRKGAYGQKGSRYGWDVDHILPQALGGMDDVSNLQITHIETNESKGDKISFWIDETLYQVKRISKLFKEDKIADYSYEGKKHCIIIIGGCR
jgi:CRISPR/Cas system Type II protein with McrA/HNH and RuvC-like nuclease domain